MKLVVMRHGQTDYNVENRYTGTTDIPINGTGRAQAIAAGTAPSVSLVYASPLKRAQETAHLCFPHAVLRTEPGLREMNFGDFQGANAKELADDPYFQQWHDSKWALPAPHGESRGQHQQMVLETVRTIVDREERKASHAAIIVAHGGVIMAICDGLLRPQEKGTRDYLSWNPGNCALICAEVHHGTSGELFLSDLSIHHHVGFIEQL
ncbi:MAG: histidine phosphatase family protein [Eggerthellaceae bacterium]|jgi:alpha-ribazole phosphatase